MRASVNAVIQVVAVAAFAGLRPLAPGWFALGFVITLIGPALLLFEVVTAFAISGRRRLEWTVAVPFVAAACCLLVAGALLPDSDDQRSYVPPVVLIHGKDAAIEWSSWATYQSVGDFALRGWAVAVVVALVACMVTAVRRGRRAEAT